MQPGNDLIPAWERKDGEPEHWYQRFWKHARPLGAEYSLKRAFRMYLAENPGQLQDMDLWAEMAAKWEWGFRAKEWVEADRTLRTHMWQQRRQEILDEDWGTGKQLRDLAKRFLDQVSIMKEASRTLGENGEEIVTMALNITPRDLATLMKTASDLQRLGVGEPTEIQGQAQPGVGIYLPTPKE